MSLKVKSLTGRILIISLFENMTIKDVKLDIQSYDGIDFTQIRLIYDGKLLNDEMVIDENLNGKTIHMVLALRGG